MNTPANVDILMQPIVLDGREYITSKNLYYDFDKPFTRISNFQTCIRNMPTYEKLIKDKHILEVRHNDGNLAVQSLIKSNSYNPVMLLDAVAQKEIDHHLQENTEQAVYSSKENALWQKLGIRSDLLAEEPETMALIQAISKAKEAKKLNEMTSKRVDGHDNDIEQLKTQNTELSEKCDTLKAKLLECYLDADQSALLLKEVDKRGYQFKDPKYIGYIKRDLKKHFHLNTTNQTVLHIKQKNFDEAIHIAKNWVPQWRVGSLLQKVPPLAGTP